MWLTANDGPDCTPFEDAECRIKVEVRLDLAVLEPSLCQYQRRPEADGTLGANRLVHVDENAMLCSACWEK